MEKLTRIVPTISTAEIDENAHDAFKRYRASDPIATLEAGGYIVLRHADVTRLSEDSRLSATGTAIPTHGGMTQGALFDIFQHRMLTANGHDHQRRRRAISRAVAGEVISEFRTSVRKAAHKLIDGYRQAGEMELGSNYAGKLPILALAGMLGLPDFEVSAFMRNVDEMNEFFRPDASPVAIAEAEFAAKRVQEFLNVLLANKRKGQPGDFLSRYLTIVDADQDVSDIRFRRNDDVRDCRFVGLHSDGDFVAGSDLVDHSSSRSLLVVGFSERGLDYKIKRHRFPQCFSLDLIAFEHRSRRRERKRGPYLIFTSTWRPKRKGRSTREGSALFSNPGRYRKPRRLPAAGHHRNGK